MSGLHICGGSASPAGSGWLTGDHGGGEQVLDQADQYGGRRAGIPGVAQRDRYVRLEFERRAHLLGLVAERAVELVDRHHELDPAALEEVDGIEAGLKAAGIGEDDRPQGAG